jgi:hypothetical protein
MANDQRANLRCRFKYLPLKTSPRHPFLKRVLNIWPINLLQAEARAELQRCDLCDHRR